MKFKCGDIVYSDLLKLKGEILFIRNENNDYLVGFKGFNGHSGHSAPKDIQLEIEKKGYFEHCWWCNEHTLHKVKEDEKPEMVNHQNHYCSCGEYENIKKMELLFGKEAVLTWARLTAFKYRDRLEFKENKEQDTAKMDWYLRYIEENEG